LQIAAPAIVEQHFAIGEDVSFYLKATTMIERAVG
jgi:hypothetical protein